MKPEELLKKGAIYFENIREGMETYHVESLYLNETQGYERLKSEWERQGRDQCFVDFYYFYLEEEAREIVREHLSEAERAYLEAMPAGETPEDVIFPAEDTLLKIVTRLNAREVLFSTIYFTGEPSTWWGNYKEEYLVFRK